MKTELLSGLLSKLLCYVVTSKFVEYIQSSARQAEWETLLSTAPHDIQEWLESNNIAYDSVVISWQSKLMVLTIVNNELALTTLSERRGRRPDNVLSVKFHLGMVHHLTFTPIMELIASGKIIIED